MSLARLAGSLLQAGTKFGPRLAATANPYLQRGAQLMGNPWARSVLGGTIGAATNQDGTLGGRLRGAALGGSFGALPIGSTPGLGWAQSAAGNQLIKAGLNPNVAQNLLNLGIPLAAVGLGSQQGSGGPGAAVANTVAGGGNQIANNAVGLLGYHAVTGEPLYGTAVPPGVGQYGGVPPVGGSLIDAAQPGGPAGTQRFTTLKNAQTMADAANAYLPTIRKFTEQAKKDDFERNMAAAGIRQNIATNAAMLQAAQAAGLGMGLTGAQQAGQALVNQYQYT